MLRMQCGFFSQALEQKGSEEMTTRQHSPVAGGLAATHLGGGSKADTEIKAPSKQSSNVAVSLAVGPSSAGRVYLGGQAPITAMI